MNILAVDCSGDLLGVGVARGSSGLEAPSHGTQASKHPYREEAGHAPGAGFVGVSIDVGYRHAERIMGAIEYCIAEAGLKPGDLDLLVCAGGPGSFTGLRIGLSTIKGLSLGLGKPFVTVPTLDAMAGDWMGAAPVIVPVIDAKRSHFYFAIYGQGRLISGPFDDGLGRIIALTQAYPEVLFVGPDSDMLEETLADRSGFRIAAERRRSSVSAMARLAAESYRSHGPSASDAGLAYIRASDAEEAVMAAASGGNP
jgi:tRNA threonylcarbamoyladenosine biosynthesis protein TsaB